MPFIRTNQHDHAEGHLLCDRKGCAATSPTFRMMLGPLPFEGWAVVPRARPVQPAVVEYFCEQHAPEDLTRP